MIAKPESLIAVAIEAAEDMRDPLEGLVEKTQSDPGARRAGPRVDAARHHHGIGSHAMSDDATLMRQLRAVRRAAIQAREEAKLAYQFVPNSYTYGALAQIELVLVRLAEIEP
jgi:hypothetical protein